MSEFAPAAIAVARGPLVAQVRANTGFEISSLTWHGLQLLARTPWRPNAPVHVADEGDWTRAWSGGWQLAAPNAGNACVADGIAQGFHGNASQGAWQIADQTARELVGRWDDRAASSSVVLSELTTVDSPSRRRPGTTPIDIAT